MLVFIFSIFETIDFSSFFAADKFRSFVLSFSRISDNLSTGSAAFASEKLDMRIDVKRKHKIKNANLVLHLICFNFYHPSGRYLIFPTAIKLPIILITAPATGIIIYISKGKDAINSSTEGINSTIFKTINV